MVIKSICKLIKLIVVVALTAAPAPETTANLKLSNNLWVNLYQRLAAEAVKVGEKRDLLFEPNLVALNDALGSSPTKRC